MNKSLVIAYSLLGISAIHCYSAGLVNGTLSGGINGINSQTIAQAGGVTITVVPNGVNDTAALQAAFNVTNSVVQLVPGDYYATNLWINASNIIIQGNGATIHQLFANSQGYWRTNTQWIGFTNFCFLINAGVNQFVPNVSIFNLTLDGGQPLNYKTLCSFTLYSGTGTGMYMLLASPASATAGNYGLTNNWGLGWNNNCGGTVANCKANNFGGVAFAITGLGQTVPYSWGPGNHFYGNSAVSNWCGFFNAYWNPAYENVSSFQSNFGNAEYATLSDLSASCCAFGMAHTPSNMKLANCSFDGNYIGLLVNGGSVDNAGPHTRFSEITCNHCISGLYIDSGCDFIGLDGFYDAATTTNIIKRSSVTFNGGTLNNVGIYNDSDTNRWVFFIGSEIAGIGGQTNSGGGPAYNNIVLKNCKISGQCSFSGGYVWDVDSFAQMAFNSWTDVITNIGGASIFSTGMQPINNYPIMSYPTNAASPVPAIAGIGYLFFGGPGGTNLYSVIKTAGGVLATNKYTSTGQWP